MKRILVILLFAVLCAAQAQAQAQAQARPDQTTRRCFNGYAYTLESGEFRYVEHHEQVLFNGQPIRWYVTYLNPQGEVIATKEMYFKADDTVPVYTFRIPADGYVEGIRHENGVWTMFRREGEHAEMETETFEVTAPMAADSGFHPLVQKYFDELMAGKTLDFRFAVAGNQSVIDMTAEKIGTTTFEGEPAVVFRASLDMFFISWFVDPLLLTYDPQTERLLEYRGIGNMHNAQGEVYPVRVSYYTEVPEVAEGIVPPGCKASPRQ